VVGALSCVAWCVRGVGCLCGGGVWCVRGGEWGVLSKKTSSDGTFALVSENRTPATCVRTPATPLSFTLALVHSHPHNLLISET
jgi:hypothetical protein